jgi:hypothetical protein
MVFLVSSDMAVAESAPPYISAPAAATHTARRRHR